MESKTDNELQITLDDFKLIKSFYPEFTRKQVASNDFIIGWSELMPVWCKAQGFFVKEYGLMTSTFEMNGMGIQIKAKDKSALKYASCWFGEPTISDVYKAVVAFLHWYNENQKTKP
jgi:hypothetical protein